MNTQTTNKSVSKQTKILKYRKILGELYKKKFITKKQYNSDLKWIRDNML